MSKTRTSKQSRFATVPGPNINRSSFNRSHGHKTTMNAGYLAPIFVDEALPGDTMSMSAHHFGRIATLLEPIMDNVYFDTHFFAVPMRLVWDNWQKFMGEQANPGDSIDYLIPTRTAPSGGELITSNADYMGIRTGQDGIQYSALPHRALALIWNEFFRDENLQDSIVIPKDDGPDPDTFNAVVLPRGKRHDYFTACLPFPQKGAAVELPLGGTAPVDMSGTTITGVGPAIPQFDFLTSAGNVVANMTWSGNTTDNDWSQSGNLGGSGAAGWNDPALQVSGLGQADLSQATAITVNALRESITLQQMLEKDARGGTRYAEIVRSHFGVISPDARLQRPEYLGGSSSPLNVMQVPNTAGDAGQPSLNQADLAAYGTITGSGVRWRKSFTEHCIIIGVASVRADLNYQQGLERMWSRSTRYDFYWPTFQNLGEQAVLNKEIYSQGTTDDDQVFGYQERYSEYKYKPNRISGAFRSDYTLALDNWHLAQDFQSLPVLDSNFIKEQPPISRVVAVQTQPQFLIDTHFNYQCARPMPVYSVPGLKRF